MANLDNLPPFGSLPFWKASILCAVVGGAIGALLALIAG